MKNVFVTRRISHVGIEKMHSAGISVTVSEKDGVLTHDELIAALREKPYDAVLCLLTDTIDGEVFDATSAKMFANYAVGFDNIDMVAARDRGIVITNTPGVLTEAVAEHTIMLMLAIARRVVESDTFTRAGKYSGWSPDLFLGTELKGKTLGLIGAGRIGTEVARMATAFQMPVMYYDTVRNESIEINHGATYKQTPDEVLRDADVISLHIPLLSTTHHLIDAHKLSLMKRTAYLINTSRGPIIDEEALVVALRYKTIQGAALDVYEHEPLLAKGLAELDNVILTPHTASATHEAREAMALIAADNIIAFLEGREPQNKI